MSLEYIELTLDERKFLLALLKTALFEELEPMRKDAISHIEKPISRYLIIGATIDNNQYIVNAKDNGTISRLIAGQIPEDYKDRRFFPFGIL